MFTVNLANLLCNTIGNGPLDMCSMLAYRSFWDSDLVLVCQMHTANPDAKPITKLLFLKLFKMLMVIQNLILTRNVINVSEIHSVST